MKLGQYIMNCTYPSELIQEIDSKGFHVLDEHDFLKTLVYFSRASTPDLKKLPKTISRRNGTKQSILVVGDSPNLDFYLKLFPFSHYVPIGWISASHSYSFIEGKSYSQLIEMADKFLLLDKSDKLVSGLDDSKSIFMVKKENNESATFHFGSSNDGVKFLSIIPQVINGIVWLGQKTIGLVNKYPGYAPIVDMQNFKNQYIPYAYLGFYNPWDYYFKPFIDYSIEDVYESSSVTISTLKYGDFPPISKDILSTRIIEKTNSVYRKLMSTHADDGILGVYLRGTDYYYTNWHKQPFDPYEAVEMAKQYMESYNLKYVFLSTEDQNNYAVFKKMFQDNLLALERERFFELHYYKEDEANLDCLQTGDNYIIDTLLICRTNGIISGSGSANATIDSFRKGGNVSFFDIIMTKQQNAVVGKVPLIVESHNRNRLKIDLNDNCGDMVTLGEGDMIHLKVKSGAGTTIQITKETPIDINILETYVCSTGPLHEQCPGAEVSLIFYDCSHLALKRKSTDALIFDRPISSVTVMLSVPGNTDVDVLFYIQIEKGPCVTAYEPYRFSTTQIALRSRQDYFYDARFLQKISFSKGVMTFADRDIPICLTEIKLFNDVVRYDHGYIIYSLNNQVFKSIEEIHGSESSSNIKYEQTVDLKWMGKLPVFDLTKQMVRSFVKNMILSNVLEFQQFALGVCKRNYKADLTLAGYIGRIYANGFGVEANIPEACKWYEMCLKGGLKWVIVEYAEMLFKDRSPLFNEELINKVISFETNNSTLFLAGRAFCYGVGVGKDPARAVSYLEMMTEPLPSNYNFVLFDALWSLEDIQRDAYMVSLVSDLSEIGNSGAIARMGKVFHYGRGVEKDLQKSKHYYEIALKKKVFWVNDELKAVLKELDATVNP